jgi:hypothetical protein
VQLTGCNVTSLATEDSPRYSFVFPGGALAQLVRAPPCHGGGCGFEPRRLRITLLLALDRENRRNDASNSLGNEGWNFRRTGQSSPHDVNGENASLMTREQVVDEITDDRVRFISELCHNPADERAAARMPF